MPPTAEAVARDIRDLVADPPPGPVLADAAVAALGRLVGHDGYCLFGVDPSSGLRAVMFSRHGLTVPNERLIHNETVERDANRYADLVAAPVRAGLLTRQATPRSPRLNEILPLDGYRSELRLALTSPGRYWGALSLFRDDVHRPFTEQDQAAADSLAPAIGAVLRRYQLGRPHRDVLAATGPAHGVVCLDHAGAVVGMDDGARAWLDALANDWADGAGSDDVLRCVHEVAAVARRTDLDHPGAPTSVALARTRIADGRWLVASATRVGGAAVDVVVQLRSGDVATVLPAFALWCGLSPRETAVLRLLVQGLAAKQVARRLGISVLTVGDHQRSLYRKAGVRGRDELISLLV